MNSDQTCLARAISVSNAGTTTVTRKMPDVERVSSDPIGNREKDAASIRIRKPSDVFDLDLVKRRDRRPKASVYMMGKKGRDRMRRNMLYVLLFPLHLAWWRRRVPSSRPFIYRLCCLYVLHSFSVFRELFRKPAETPVEFVELMLPFLLLIIMSVLMGQSAASAIAPVSPIRTPPILKPADCDVEPIPLNSPAMRSEGSVRDKIARRLRRRTSKSDNGMANDSTNENFTNDDEDEAATGSSADSDSSDTPSDSSADEGNKKTHRPQVAIRRSSLLGTPTSPQPLSGLPAYETLGARNGAVGSPQNKRAITTKYTSALPPRSASAAANGHPTSPNNASLLSNGPRSTAKSRFFGGRFQRHNTEPMPPPSKDNILSTADEADSDTEESEDDDDDEGEDDVIEGVSKGTKNPTENKGLQRNRLFSQSMEDVLESVKSVHWFAHGPEKIFFKAK